MTESNDRTEQTETGTVFPNPNETVFPSEIGTDYLSEIVGNVIGRPITTKRLRITLRKIFRTSGYTSYRFRYPSNTVDRIVERFVNDETVSAERRKRTAERSDRRTEPKPILTVSADGTTGTEPTVTNVVPINTDDGNDVTDDNGNNV